MITSSQNTKLKLVRSLLSRARDRREAGAFVAEGVRLLEEAAASSWPVRFVLYSERVNERAANLVANWTSAGVEVEQVMPDLLSSLSGTETSQGILAVLNDHSLPLPAHPDFLLIPDEIRDPGNLGTLIRSAAAAGVQALLIPPETTDPFAPKVVRSAMGSHFRLPIVSMPWPEIQEYGKEAGLRFCVADMEGIDFWRADLRSPIALIIGSEAEGASEAGRRLASEKISIPMPGKTESLNAGVAGSVLMFEVVRQRLTN